MSSIILALLATPSSSADPNPLSRSIILALRHQLGVLHCSTRKRPSVTSMLWAWLSVSGATAVGTRHREAREPGIARGFRLFWTWNDCFGKTDCVTRAVDWQLTTQPHSHELVETQVKCQSSQVPTQQHSDALFATQLNRAKLSGPRVRLLVCSL